MVDIYLREGEVDPNDVALCDPTIPCTPPGALTPWGWESTLLLSALALTPAPPPGDVFGPLGTPAGFESLPTPRPPAPVTPAPAVGVLPALLEPWGFSTTERPTPTARAPHEPPVGVWAAPKPWGWESEHARAPRPPGAILALSAVFPGLAAVAPWGWAGFEPPAHEARGFVLPVPDVFPEPVGPTPPTPTPPIEPKNPAVPAAGGGGGGTGGAHQNPPFYQCEVVYLPIPIESFEGPEYIQRPYKLEKPNFSVGPKPKAIRRPVMVCSQVPPPKLPPPIVNTLSDAAKLVKLASILSKLLDK